MRRSGDIVTIVGASAGPLNQRVQPGQFAWIELKNMDKTIALSGARVPLCDGDDVAASGTYTYAPDGGTLLISDVRNIDWQFSGYVGRFSALVLSVYPAWCGFPGMPINPN